MVNSKFSTRDNIGMRGGFIDIYELTDKINGIYINNCSFIIEK